MRMALRGFAPGGEPARFGRSPPSSRCSFDEALPPLNFRSMRAARLPELEHQHLELDREALKSVHGELGEAHELG